MILNKNKKMKIGNFFDKLEDRIRGYLSRRPILYGLIGGVSIVIFWRGVWETADQWGVDPFWSTVVSALVMLASGLFVSFFIGESILISGLRQEKKLTEKTESEVKHEMDYLIEIKKEIKAIRAELKKHKR